MYTCYNGESKKKEEKRKNGKLASKFASADKIDTLARNGKLTSENL